MSAARGRESWLVFSLMAIAACALLARLAAMAEPFGMDQGLWASAVRAMSRGQRLYVDVWEQRPPGIYATYLAAFSLGRWSAGTLAALDVLASTATAAFLYAIAAQVSGRRAAALATALYAVLTMPAWLYGYGGFLERSVCETFIVVCAGGAVWCAARFRGRPAPAPAFGLGAWAGAAAIYKPNAVLYVVPLAIWAFAALPGTGWRRYVPWATRTSIGVGVAPALALAWIWSAGLGPEARIAIVDFNRWYVGEGFSLTAYASAFWTSLKWFLTTDPLWLSGSIATLVALGQAIRGRRIAPLAAAGIAWGVGATLVIGVNGMRLFNTYFIQVLPPLALTAAWLLDGGWSSSRPIRAVAAATVILMGWLLVSRDFLPRVVDRFTTDVAAWRGTIDRADYLQTFGGYANGRGYSARANDELATYLKAHTVESDRIFLFGINGAGVYYMADRLPAHRFLRVNFFVPDAFPDPRFTLPAVVDDLRRRQPAYLIFETLHQSKDADMARAVDGLRTNPALEPLLAGYRFETDVEDFHLYRRVGRQDH